MDLSTASTDDLIRELFGRYDAALVALSRSASVDDDGTEGEAVLRRWHGNDHTCLGLTQDIRYSIHRFIRTQYDEV